MVAHWLDSENSVLQSNRQGRTVHRRSPMRWHRSVGFAVLAAAGMTAAGLAQERFDYQVRDDMFRAFGGNEAALKNAQAMIEAKLSEDPDHAEALVWRGAARYCQ